MTQPPEWVTTTPSSDVHQVPGTQSGIELPGHQQILDLRGQLLENSQREFLRAVQGFFSPLGGPTFTQLQSWAAGIPILGDIAEVMTGIEDGDLNDLGTWANNLLGYHNPVPEVQAASVVDTNPNLILAPTFAASPTIVTELGHGWAWDNSAGHDSIGCAKITVAGVLDELVSNEIRVVEGQKLDLSVWVKWPTSITYTGTNPFGLGVTRYRAQSRSDGLVEELEIGSDDVASIASPASTSDWVQLVKSGYEVPPGCDELRLRLKVAPNLTAGTIFWDDASVTKTQPGSGYIGNLLDTTINGLENVNQPGWDLTDLLISMLNQFRTTVDHAARITLLENLLTTGNKINDEFLRVGTTLGSNWNQAYIGFGAGTWETDGDNAFWNKSGVDTLDVRCRYIGTPSETLTDTQKITAILGSKGEVGFLPSIFGLLFICESHVDLYGRMNTTGTEGTDWIRARFSASGDVYIHRSLAGVVTQLAHTENWDFLLNPNGSKPAGAGATITLLCGTDSGARFFEAHINGEAVCVANDSTSNVGASYRGYGHGARAEGSILILGQAAPSRFNAWAAVDN